MKLRSSLYSFGRTDEPLFAFPAYRNLNAATKHAFEETDRAYCACAEGGMDRLINWLDQVAASPVNRSSACYTVLKHPLSRHYMSIHPDSAWVEKSKREIDAVHATENGSLTGLLTSEPGLDEFLKSLCKSLGGSATGFRTRPARTQPDRFGNFTTFTAPETLVSRLAELRSFLGVHSGKAPVAFLALVAQLAVVNSHFFSNGNGRTSRALYNWIMSRELGVRFYLPIYELARLSQGGHIIRVRTTTLRGDWQPIAEYFAAASQLFRT